MPSLSREGPRPAHERAPDSAPRASVSRPPVEDFLVRIGPGLRVSSAELEAARTRGKLEKEAASLSLPGVKARSLALDLDRETGCVTGGHVGVDLDVPYVRPPTGWKGRFNVAADGGASFHVHAQLAVPALHHPALDLSLKEGQLSGEATVSAPQMRSRDLSGLKITEASATIGISGGRLSGSGRVALEYASLARAGFGIEFRDGEPTGQGDVELTPTYLKGVRAGLRIQRGEIEGSVTLPASKLAPPIPGLKITDGTLSVGMKDGQLVGMGEGITLSYRDLGKADLSFSIVRGQVNGRGHLALAIPGIAPVRGELGYREGKLAGSATITAEKLPRGLPVKGGALTVVLDESAQVSGRGQMTISLPGAGDGDLRLAYEKGILDLGAAVTLRKVPGLEEGHVAISIRNGRLQGEGQIALASRQVPGLSGNLLVAYKDDRFSGKGRVAFARDRLSGEIELVLAQDEKAKLQVSGQGDVTARLTDWLSGKVHVELLPDAKTRIAGELKADDTLLFPEKKADRELFSLSQHVPLWAILVAVIRVRGGVRAGVGPGLLRGVTAQGQFSTVPGEAAGFSIRGELYIPAYAEAYVAIGAGLGVDVVIGSLTGGIEAVGTAGIYGAISVVPEIDYQGGHYSIAGVATLAAGAKIKLGLQAWAEVEALWVTVWSKEWRLAEWIWDVGPQLALQAQVNYVFGRPEPPSFDFKTSDIDAKRLLQDAMPKEGPRGSGAREALQNRAEWKGKLKEQRKEAARIPPELVEKHGTAPQAREPPPRLPRSRPPADLRISDDRAAGRALGRDLERRARPAAAPIDRDHQERWNKGMAALERLSQGSRAHPETEAALATDLHGLKGTYGFTSLAHRLEDHHWIVEATMSEPRRVRIEGVDPHLPDGTEEKPFPLKWPKREARLYEPLYFGGPIGTLVKQKILKERFEQKERLKQTDSIGFTVEKYSPTELKPLQGGRVEIGIQGQFQPYVGMKLHPVEGTSPGGGKLNDVLRPYGFSPNNEEPRVQTDHIIEIQMGGKDTRHNLWPLNPQENMSSGATLRNMKVILPTGEEKSMSDLKREGSRGRQYYFEITDFTNPS